MLAHDHGGQDHARPDPERQRYYLHAGSPSDGSQALCRRRGLCGISGDRQGGEAIVSREDRGEAELRDGDDRESVAQSLPELARDRLKCC
ncbi:hypothetical protein D3C71_324070 [compost metagenome]